MRSETGTKLESRTSIWKAPRIAIALEVSGTGQILKEVRPQYHQHKRFYYASTSDTNLSTYNGDPAADLHHIEFICLNDSLASSHSDTSSLNARTSISLHLSVFAKCFHLTNLHYFHQLEPITIITISKLLAYLESTNILITDPTAIHEHFEKYCIFIFADWF